MAASQFRSTYLLTGLFIVLLLIVVFYENTGSDKERKSAEIDRPLLNEQQITSIDEVVFQTPKREVRLSLSDDGSAQIDDGGLVDRDEWSGIEEELMGLSVGRVVSKNKENWVKYGLGEGLQKTLVVYADGSDLLTMYFGAGGNTPRSVYARIEGEDEVREVTTQISRFFTYDTDTWKNKYLVLAKRDDIQGVNVRLGEEAYTLTKSEAGVWMWNAETGNVPVDDTEMVQSYLDGLLSLKATGFAEEGVSVDSGENVLTLTLDDGTSSVITIRAGDEENQYFASVSGIDEVFTLGSDLRVPLKPAFVEELNKEMEEDDTTNDEEVLDSDMSDDLEEVGGDDSGGK